MAFLQIFLVFITFCQPYKCNEEPVIGILTNPCPDDMINDWCTENSYPTYFASSYVKWLESGGAKVIPILYDDSWENTEDLLSNLNGVLFTGGSLFFDDTHPFFIRAKRILNYLKEYAEKNKNDNSAIPFWGTCLGFEILTSATSENWETLFSEYDANDIMRNIDYTKYGTDESRMYHYEPFLSQEYSQLIIRYTSDFPTTVQQHSAGISPDTFENDKYLSGNFSSLGTAIDSDGRPFIQLIDSNEIDGVQLSWYGSQFHPEKASFQHTTEWKPNIGHDSKTIVANLYYAQFFVNECKIRNNNQMDDKLLKNIQIKNYDAVYMKNESDHFFEEIYAFDNEESSSSSSDSVDYTKSMDIVGVNSVEPQKQMFIQPDLLLIVLFGVISTLCISIGIYVGKTMEFAPSASNKQHFYL